MKTNFEVGNIIQRLDKQIDGSLMLRMILGFTGNNVRLQYLNGNHKNKTIVVGRDFLNTNYEPFKPCRDAKKLS